MIIRLLTFVFTVVVLGGAAWFVGGLVGPEDKTNKIRKSPTPLTTPELVNDYNTKTVIIDGNRYLLQKQEVGPHRSPEWRVVAGPLP